MAAPLGLSSVSQRALQSQVLHAAQRHWLGTVPQVTDTLQEVLTNTCSLKTTIQAFQEELQLLKDSFQKVCEWSWALGK